MKRLILMRHGEAPKRLEDSDVERSLTPLGEEQCHASGQFMKKYNIGYALCSSVKRTRQTLDCVQKEVGISEGMISFCKEIYENNSDLLSRLVDIQNNEEETMLMVGHNPSLLELAVYYDNRIDTKWDDILSLGLHHAEAIVIEFKDCAFWGELYKGKGEVVDIFIPNIESS